MSGAQRAGVAHYTGLHRAIADDAVADPKRQQFPRKDALATRDVDLDARHSRRRVVSYRAKRGRIFPRSKRKNRGTELYQQLRPNSP
jgi:hypothetical protein